jgi:hypothetical protein
VPGIPVDAADAIELAELLGLLRDWLESDRDSLAVSLARFTDSPTYGPSELRDDMARFPVPPWRH